MTATWYGGTGKMTELIALINGDVLETHEAGQCSGQHCCIHNPSQHVLNDKPLSWREDRKLMERLCDHGQGHPDPDDLAHKKRVLGQAVFKAHMFDVHCCDGCCREPRQ